VGDAVPSGRGCRVPAGGAAKATQIDMRDQEESKAPSTTPMASCPGVHVSVSECWQGCNSVHAKSRSYESHTASQVVRVSVVVCVTLHSDAQLF
jgi:hypothetical protein